MTIPIFSDDPHAEERLQDRIARLEARQAAYKRINKVCQSLKLVKGEPGVDSRLRQAVSDGRLSGEDIQALSRAIAHDWRDKIAFPAYLLTNNNANIRRYKARLADLSR